MAHIRIKEKVHRGKTRWQLYCELQLTVTLDSEKEAQELAVRLLAEEARLNLTYILDTEKTRATPSPQ